ncbi:MAG: hypothetical protein L0H53_12445 [Candidatus Nitrosocosmicus sp.]|nr:hypothetical protein [Candidatus Nitrosocosmicus sp.]MDN5868350.1 hypothetical protein [Candidatus Nitrosocosmicus sp.]
MQSRENISNIYKFTKSKYLIITLSIVLLSSTFILNPGPSAFAQQQQDSASLVNSICQLVRSNSLIAGLVGLDQALNICNNLNAIGSNQALSELCYIVGGLNVINIDALCEQQKSSQTQPLNETNETADSQDGTQQNQGSTENPGSNSIIDRILGLLLGFLKF